MPSQPIADSKIVRKIVRKPVASHPLHPITPQEIRDAVAILRRVLAEQDKKEGRPITQMHFKNVSIHEPPKAHLRPYLDAEASGVPLNERPFVPRLVDIIWCTNSQQYVRENVVSLDNDTVVGETAPGEGQHSSLDRDESRFASQKILSDSSVLAAIDALRLPKGTIVQCDAWMYGADMESNVDTHKLIQGYLYARAPNNHTESNQYSFPLPLAPILDVFTGSIVEIQAIPSGGKEDGFALNTAGENPISHCIANEYHPDLVTPREGLKPLQVVQPEGPSFTVTDGNCIVWQKWRFRVGFNYREGMTIHDVRYDGRAVFYRLSVSEMTVPYGDPRGPFHRKQAMDLGDAGAGSTANSLELGCDCLGVIKYFAGYLNDSEGNPVEARNVICLHEQDGGIGWKHTNHRTRVAAVTRSRNLILQSVLTVGNYEYIFAWCFMQNGNVELETRATGILSTSLIDEGKTSYWGNVVSPGVLAANHQHFFSLRIDPMIDGHNNTVLVEESHAVPEGPENPHGNAWKVIKTPITTSGWRDADSLNNRAFKIVNESRLNTVSQQPVGYKIVPHPCQLLLAGTDSVVRRRARFAEHHFWVTRYRDGDLWAAGKWTNQSLAEIGGLHDYAARAEDVANHDIVCWLTYGMTHNPRVEDFPVMPVEISVVSLKPADFFDRNPAIDVPASQQAVNRSQLHTVTKEESGRGCCNGVPSM
ncbi:putative copper amine oxidase [Aureobasidium pullulans]|nr:putative copper amine oxidase [Aureobasidium pullulans]